MSKQAWTWTTCERLPSRLGAEEAFMRRLLAELGRTGWTEREIFGVRLSVEEALVNAIKHGNRLHPEKQVGVACRVARHKVWIEITDQGAGFDPDALPDPTAPENLECPNGRGVLLMRNFMSRVEYNPTGNRVVMEKTKDPAPLPRRP